MFSSRFYRLGQAFCACLVFVSLWCSSVLAAGDPVQPLLPEVLRINGMEEQLNAIPPDLRTSGVTHVVGQDILPGTASTLSLNFDFNFLLGGKEIKGESRTCGSGCRLLTAGKGTRVVEKDGQMTLEKPVVIYRFAKDGRIELEDGTGVNWLVRMVDGDTLRGTLRQPLGDKGEPGYPAELELDGKMIITMQVDGEEPVNLLSELDSSLVGEVYEWPPKGTKFQLNEHVPYYDSRMMGLSETPNELGVRTMALLDQMTEPAITIVENNTSIGQEPSPFLSISPDILETKPVNTIQAAHAGQALPEAEGVGLAITWRDTSHLITGPKTCPCQQYSVYRNTAPGDLDGWRLIAQVPSSQTTYVDSEWDKNQDTEYMILNGSEFTFGYLYEGSPGQATLVPAIR